MNRKDYMKNWTEENREHIRAYDREHYRKYGKKKLERAKVNYQKNKDKIKANHRKYYAEHREEMIKKNNEYKKSNREHYTELNRLSRKRKSELLAGRPKPDICEICGANEKIVYDHDHATGKFRGWICFSCNTALGHARDNPEVLYKLIDYLNKSRNQIVIEKSQLSNVPLQ